VAKGSFPFDDQLSDCALECGRGSVGRNFEASALVSPPIRMVV
jgi:hypothetical protein